MSNFRVIFTPQAILWITWGAVVVIDGEPIENRQPTCPDRALKSEQGAKAVFVIMEFFLIPSPLKPAGPGIFY